MKRKTKSPPQAPKAFWASWIAPLRLFLVLFLTFGLSTVGRAAEKIKRGLKTKKNNLKASYQALLTAKAWAYFKPAWVGADSKDFTPELQGIQQLLDDPDSRIEKDFKVRSGLRNRVAFWIDIYARFTSEYRILHDKDKPELIYGYLDFRPLYRALPKRVAHARAHQIEERVTKELKERIAEAMDISKPKQPHLSEQEKKDMRALLARFDIHNAQDALRPMKRVRAQTGQKDHYLKGIARSQKMIGDVEQIFREKGLPVGLARLPFVESSYNRYAVSKVGAMGMWQFLPETARLFAPHSTWNELSDPLKQSKSAARMFSILRDKFDDWGLAVTAYNSGAVRVKRIADTNSANDVEKLIRVPLKRGNLGFAGNNFYCEFLAALHVEAYKDRLFTAQEVQLAKLDHLPRKIQSLLGSNSFAPTPAPIPPVAAAAPAPSPEKKTPSLKKQPRAKAKLVAKHRAAHHRHPKKKARASKTKHGRRHAHRARSQSRRG